MPNPTEDARRWRGYHLLEVLCAYTRGELWWESLTAPQHAKPTRGVFDPTRGYYDQDAGPRESVPGPRIHTVDIPRLAPAGYPGESITMTPAWLDMRRRDLHRAGIWNDVRDYARGDATYQVASWWPSRRAVRWSNRAPRPLRDACRLLSDAEPMNPNTIRAPLPLTREPRQERQNERAAREHLEREPVLC